jgi:hypothetical protein
MVLRLLSDNFAHRSHAVEEVNLVKLLDWQSHFPKPLSNSGFDLVPSLPP